MTSNSTRINRTLPLQWQKSQPRQFCSFWKKIRGRSVVVAQNHHTAAFATQKSISYNRGLYHTNNYSTLLYEY